MNLRESELCVDVYGEKNNRENKRYWLTRKRVDFHIVRSFSMKYKPIELNVFYSEDGDDLFLYDTSVHERNEFFLQNDMNSLIYFHLFSGLKQTTRQIGKVWLFKILRKLPLKIW
mgnify:CR=1 FL=1